MEVVNNTFLPGDPRLIDHIVYELKSQGIFDNFRKECIADVDTKPAYQNLRQRVEGSVSGFLKTQKWRSDMNKNHVREMLRKNISDGAIVDQVVNPKINSVFLPQVENVVYKVLGIEKPTAFDDLKNEDNVESSNIDLLPNDLEAVSPESEPQEKKVDISSESKVDEKIDEDESPPFEPLEENMPLEENSVDSNLSGISGLVSHDSNHSVENKPVPMETSNQDSQFSKQSSDDRLSIVMSDDQEIKTETNEDSNASIGKIADSITQSADVPDSSTIDKGNEKCDEQEKSDEKRNESKKIDKHRSSHKHSSHRSRHDSRDHKDRKSDRDKKDHKSSRSTGEDSKEKRDKDKDRKDRSRSGRDDKGSKNSKERERTTSNSKHKKKDSEHKDRSESKDSKSRDRSKEDTKTKSHSSKKTDSKNHSKHNGKTKADSSDSTKTSSDKKSEKHKREERHSSDKRNDKYKDKKDSKKEGKKEKDDHYSLKEKKSHRRSTDRDSSDGHSGTHSSSSSYTELTTPSQVQKTSQESSLVSGSSSGGDSGNSDAALIMQNLNISSIPCILSQEEHSQLLASVPRLKLIKPKFASNIFEARRLMKIRRKLGKLEKQKQMELIRANNSLNPIVTSKFNNHFVPGVSEEQKKQKPDVLKKHVNNSHVKSYKYQEKCVSAIDDDHLVEEVQLTDDTELQTSVISKESWDAIEAKLNAQNILKVDYNSYTATTEVKQPKVVQADDSFKGCMSQTQLEANRRLDLLSKIIEQQEFSLVTMCKSQKPHREKLPVVELVTDHGIGKLPKIEIVDVTNVNEVVFSPGRGVKRMANDHDLRNNNKVNKELGDLLSDRLNVLTENHDQSSNPTPKSKKSKLTDTSVNSLDSFNLPLSPAESDKSFNSVGDKKIDVLDGRSRRNRAINTQRYSSDDLYKPRLQFTSKRRRNIKNSEAN
ncbi:hypothetical protein RN001_011591 [Aquatica leii]|uniref:BOD1/SHG1 domain-containing protein n=1 Tax=Aquatica leii TaxID=1421715 RepID=A0AAN7P1R1_9COLE|nr:hypothetical protein RN001_011591 [Aquatica leii]